MWDERYSVEQYVYGKVPNDFLVQMYGKLKTGDVLCLAEGEGRNAVYLAEYRIEKSAWDSIVSISCHVQQDLRRRLHRDVVTGLREGGTFLLEAYTPKQLEFGTGEPSSTDYLMDLETLRKELHGLEIIHGKELVRDVVEGSHHTRKASVVQILARRA